MRDRKSQGQGLCHFLDSGRIEIDTNVVERSIQPIASSRTNAIFAGKFFSNILDKAMRGPISTPIDATGPAAAH